MESHFRSILKALSWRLIGLLITSSIAWVVTGQIRFAAAIGLADAMFKLGAYYGHERAWNTVRFGRLKPPEYQI